MDVQIPQPTSDPRSDPPKNLRSADLNPKKTSDPTKILTLKIADLEIGTTLIRSLTPAGKLKETHINIDTLVGIYAFKVQSILTDLSSINDMLSRDLKA